MPDTTDTDLPLAEPLDDFGVGGRGEEEALFARDDNDFLVRREKETAERFRDFVTVTIDGYPVEIPRAVPKTDSQGSPLRGPDGELVPRTSTIYDAAMRLVTGYTNSKGEFVPRVWSEEELKRRIPVLCHQPHLNPIGVCRMCSVHVSSLKRGKLTPGRKLVPSCQHRVEKDMVVTTQAGPDGYNPDAPAKADPEQLGKFAKDVSSSVRLLAELLLADHRHPDPSPVPRYENELEAVARNLKVVGPRPRLPRNPGGDDGRNALNIARRDDPSRVRIPLGEGRPVDELGTRYARARRIALPLAHTDLPPERIDDEAAQTAWEAWNATIDEKFPYSSRTVVVDHDRCILCDRCVRSCSEVKPFKVIGHTGKGYNSRISFDLDFLMGESSCVQCGECMTSCPTGALSLRRRVQPRAWDDSPEIIPQHPNTPFPAASGFLTADEMRNIWLYYVSPTRGPRVVFPFRSVPYAYLKWNEGSVRKWEIPAGERRVLCKQDEYGSTAFLLQGTGKFHVYTRPAGAAPKKPGLLARLFGGGKSADPAAGGDFGQPLTTVKGNQLVLGEMACLTHRARNATVIAEADPEVPALELSYDSNGWPTARVLKKAEPVAVVYEVTRNLLDMMQRAASAREDLEEVYAARALQNCLFTGKIFGTLSPDERGDVARFLLGSKRVAFRRVAPGEGIVAEGDPASDFYVIRIGTVRVFRTVGGREQVQARLGADEYFGEVALLAEELGERNLLPPGTDTRRRSASVAAIDPVELVRVPGSLFREMCDRFPDVREKLIDGCANMFAGGALKPPPGVLNEYVAQGLFQGQKLLVLDLTCCTRCDECTRACADSHRHIDFRHDGGPGHARLLREGLRFGDYLVATSCRSCHKPYCMEGCPVDAIHRHGNHLEVVIEDHCIGCGLCERNCPYGAIRMVERGVPNRAAEGVPGGDPNVVASTGHGPRRAVNCDLCGPVGGEPFCVQACPHDAAFRVDGPTLLHEVTVRGLGGGRFSVG
jgi:Fe-S-cluster-containing hydrogenase component 2